MNRPEHPRRLTAPEGISTLRRLAALQVAHARREDWEAVFELMDQRSEVLDSMGDPSPGVLRPLRNMLEEIEVLDNDLSSLISRQQKHVLTSMKRSDRSLRTIGAYLVPDPLQPPRYLDERK